MNAQFSIRIPDELLERVRGLAEKSGTTVPMLVRDLLDKYAENSLSFEERISRLEEAVSKIEKQIQK